MLSWCWNTFNILIGTRTGTKITSDALGRVPHRIEGNLKLFDITEQFRLAAKALPVGTLVKDEHFTLFESVGALEVWTITSLFLSTHSCLADWGPQNGQRFPCTGREIGRRL